ncbi:helix-turn-helix transcriptional regulator [Streptomyces sp. NPDC050388]|uniref:helix-turn-helix domain-containing protein n=1 Tax=Streptomyces sp. NPDC050388 TaxID=3155781 RepID=UPI0034359AEB
MKQSAHPYVPYVRMRDGERTRAGGEFDPMSTTARPRSRSRRNASAMKMVGALLATFREAAGHTQRSLGEQFVVSEQQIASIEQGRRPLNHPSTARRNLGRWTQETVRAFMSHSDLTDVECQGFTAPPFGAPSAAQHRPRGGSVRGGYGGTAAVRLQRRGGAVLRVPNAVRRVAPPVSGR